MRNVITIFGVLLSLAAVVPYWLEALKGRAKPNMVSWFTWTLLTLIASSAALANGNWQVGIVILANALGTASVVML